MEFELTWNPTVSTEVCVGYGHRDGVSVGVGGVSVVGASVKITEPDNSLHNWQFGYVQNVLCAKNIWIYRDVQPREKIKKELLLQCLDQGSAASGFFFNSPVKTVHIQPQSLNLPEFKDYPRTFGVVGFNRVFGASLFVLWVMAFNPATRQLKVLGHRYWQVFFDLQKDPVDEETFHPSADTGVIFRLDGEIRRPNLRLDGPRANSGAVQRSTKSILVNRKWQDVPEDNSSGSESSSSSSESDVDSTDNDSSDSLEVEAIDANELEIPPGLRGLGRLTW